MQFKNTRLFFSRAGMTHYPGSNAGSLVGWVIPQYSETQIAPVHHLQSYSSFGTVTTTAMHIVHNFTTAHARMCWNPGKRCVQICFRGGRVKSQVAAIFQHVYPFFLSRGSLIQ